ncbi:MAG: cysteine synthase family protein [Clostridia bacterium]|nr:cysteine synthase family protein [Clostridia bacterium]
MGAYVKNNITKLIGKTPILAVPRLCRAFGCKADIYVKLEGANPGGSVKDRAAVYMIKNALERGVIGKDTTVIAATGGSSAISLAMVCAAYRLDCVIVMPDDTPSNRVNAVKMYGAKVFATPASGGVQATKQAAEVLRVKLGNGYVFDFFESEDAVDCHREGTAIEILDALGNVDILVAGVGTGATITGCGEVIKRNCPECSVIAVEPAESAALSGGAIGSHGISGIGAGFVPPMLNTYLLSEVIRVRTADAKELCRMIAKTEGIICGTSSGAALAAAVTVAQRPESAGKTLVCILPDRGEGNIIA